MKRAITFVAVIMGTIGCTTTTTDRAEELRNKEIFQNLYPKHIVFRGEGTATNDTYEHFANAAIYAGGHLQKYVPYDEVPSIDPYRTAGFVSRYVKENPEKIALLHWDAQEHVNNIPESANRYFPGHWQIFEGKNNVEAIKASDNTFKVSDVTIFNNLTTNPKARNKWQWPVLILLELDDEGKPIWENYEYVELESVDTDASTLTVKRGCALSEPRDFPAGSRVCQIATYISSPYLFCLNYSTSGPRDKNGKSMVDIEFEEIVELFEGRLSELDGIGFDVLTWKPRFDRSRIDSDGDGVADGAYDPITGEDLWRKGAYDLQKRLREHFGDDFILSNDSSNKDDQRALGIFNGMESEGLVQHNDAFRGFSKTVNIFKFWHKNNPLAYNLSYIVPKLKNETDMANADNMLRLCYSAATSLGASICQQPTLDPETSTREEITGGSLNKIYWLGATTSEMRDYSFEGRNLLEGDDCFFQNFTTKGCTASVSGDVMSVSGVDKSRMSDNSYVSWAEYTVPADVRDICVIFEIKAEEPLKGMDEFIPRIVDVKVDGLPAYEGNSNDNMYNNTWCNFTTNDYTEVICYYRDVASRKLKFNFDVEGQGDFKIKNMRINASTQALAREFENGLVLVNPSLHDFTFDLSEFDAPNGYKRLDGKGYPNNGEDAGKIFTLEPLDGIFLIKK